MNSSFWESFYTAGVRLGLDNTLSAKSKSGQDLPKQFRNSQKLDNYPSSGLLLKSK